MTRSVQLSFPTRPVLLLPRVCTACGADFQAGYYLHRQRDGAPALWRPYPRCKECKRKASRRWFHQNAVHARAVVARAQKLRKAAGTYGLGKWWGDRKALALYRKCVGAGIAKDEARHAAVALFNKRRST